MKIDHIAHYNKSNKEIQILETHLKNVGLKCKEIGRKIIKKNSLSDQEKNNFLNFCYNIGFFHDIGKIRNEYKEYITKNGKKTTHSCYSEIIYNNFLSDKIKNCEHDLLKKIILSHHSGFKDENKEIKKFESIDQYFDDINTLINENNIDILDNIKFGFKNYIKYPVFYFLFVKFLFSMLIDSDYLDTELFFDSQKYIERDKFDNFDILSNRLNEYMSKKISKTDRLNDIRNNIRELCIEKSKENKNLFLLNTSTGSGKTLSSLHFAINYLKEHKKDRIIYVLPYTTIIDQIAREFSDIFGENNVIQHYSNFVEDIDDDENTNKNKLGCDNWNAPIILTTTVQFFESFFSNKPSKNRKLHNILNSIVIFDEIQMLPLHLLKHCFSLIKYLSYKNFSDVCFLLMTATYPKYSYKGNQFIKDSEMCYIIDENKNNEFNEFLEKRFNCNFINNLESMKTVDELCDNILFKYNKFLLITNTKKKCGLIYKKLKNLNKKNVYYLSTNMCLAHRQIKLKEIENKLKNNEDVIVISTQLIECGVDIDFPVVFREYAGLDSIIQSGGRCNRNFKLDKGNLFIFKLDLKDNKNPKDIQFKCNCLDGMRSKFIKDNIKCFDDYIKSLSNSSGKIQKSVKKFEDLFDDKVYVKFEKISELKVIEDSDTKEVFIDKYESLDLSNIRKLKKYCINVYIDDYNKHTLCFEEKNGFVFLKSEYYEEDMGMVLTSDLENVIIV